MTELQAKGLAAVAKLKALAIEVLGADLAPRYMEWVKETAKKFGEGEIALAFVEAQIRRLGAQKLFSREV